MPSQPPYPALFGTLDDGRQQFAPDAMSLRGRDHREHPISTFAHVLVTAGPPGPRGYPAEVQPSVVMS